MKDETKAIKFKRIIAAEPAAVFAAFTQAPALREWLCSVAEADAHQGGRIYFWWNSGYYASGEFIRLEPDERISFSWHGRNEPGITQVKVVLKPQEQGTLLVLTHSGLGKNKSWKNTAREFQKGWEKYLENLQSSLETGQDLRLVRRPLLGITGAAAVTPELAAQRGLAVKKGLVLDGVGGGFGAEKAGLQKNDVLTRLGGFPLKNLNDLGTALSHLTAGKEVKAVYYRGPEKKTTQVTLSGRPIPEIPPSLESLAATLDAQYETQAAELAACFENATEAEADYQPGGEWNARQSLAHLISAERDLHAWIASLAEGDEIADIFHGGLARSEALIAAFPGYRDLLAEYRRSQVITIMLLKHLPVELEKRKGSFWNLGYRLLSLVDHSREHIQQINQGLQASREQIPLLTDAPIAPEAQQKPGKPPAKKRRSQKKPDPGRSK